MHPYEIEKVIEARSMRYWTDISMSSVYKLLRKLEQEKLVSSTTRMSKRNLAQKIYALTPAGRAKLKARIKELLTAWSKPIWPIDVGLSWLDLLGAKDLAGCFKSYEASLDEQIEGYGRLKEYLETHCPLPNQQLACRPLALLQAEKQWLREFAAAWRRNSKRG